VRGAIVRGGFLHRQAGELKKGEEKERRKKRG
jgi:hypothetical protein